MITNTRYHLQAEINRQQKLAAEIARAQTDISNKIRLQRPSDDPAASARVADIRRAQANEAVWARNVDSASALATRADATLTSVANALDRARELITLAKSGNYNDNDRAVFALELRAMADEIAELSQAKDSRGQPIFADGEATAVPIGPGVFVSPSISRDGVFTNVPTSSGPRDLAQILYDAANGLELTDSAQRAAANDAALTDIVGAVESVAVARGEQGVRAARLDSARERFATSGLVLTEERSTLEDTDITATIAKLQAKQLSLDAAQAVFARINRQTLFDLLG